MSGKSVYFQAIIKEGAAAYIAGFPLGMNPYRNAVPVGRERANIALRRKKHVSWQHGWRLAMVEHDRQVLNASDGHPVTQRRPHANV